VLNKAIKKKKKKINAVKKEVINDIQTVVDGETKYCSGSCNIRL
jgi:hypothetical protein